MQCIYCGRQLPDSAKFCTGCGHSLSGSAADDVPAPLPPHSYDEAQTVFHPSSAEAEPGLYSSAAVRAGRYSAPTPSRQGGQTWNADRTDSTQQAGGGYVYSGQTQYRQRARQIAQEPVALDSSARSVRQSRLPFWRSFLSVLLCIVLVAAGLCAALLGTVRRTLNGDRIQASIEKLDIRNIEMPGEDGGTISLSRFFEDTVEMDLDEAYGIRLSELEDLLDASFVKRFVGERVGNYTAYLIGDAPLRPLTRNDVIDFFRGYNEEIKRITGYDFLQAEHDALDSYNRAYDLDSIFDSLGTREIDAAFLQEETGMNLSGVRRALSETTLIALIVLCAACLVLIFLLLWGHMRSFFCRTGVCMVVLGGILLLLGGVGVLGIRATGIGLLQELLNPLFKGLLVIGGALTGGGIGMIVLRHCFRKAGRGMEKA